MAGKCSKTHHESIIRACIISHYYNYINNVFYCLSSGPSKAEISGVDGKIATVKKLQEGHYVFKLTVTDDKGLTGTDTVAVSVKKGAQYKYKYKYTI